MRAYPPKKGQATERQIMKDERTGAHEMKKHHHEMKRERDGKEHHKMRHMDASFERETERRDRERNNTKLDKSSLSSGYLAHCKHKKD